MEVITIQESLLTDVQAHPEEAVTPTFPEPPDEAKDWETGRDRKRAGQGGVIYHLIGIAAFIAGAVIGSNSKVIGCAILKVCDGGLRMIADIHMGLVTPAEGSVMHDIT